MIAVMPSRLQDLTASLAGYSQTHLHFVATTAHGLGAGAVGNDLGGFFAIISLAAHFGWSVQTAASVFLTSIVLIGFVASLIGVTRLWRGSRYYWWSVAGITLLTLISYKVGDVYVASSAAVLGITPYILLMLRKTRITPGKLWGFFFCGLLCGIANSIRADAGTTIILFAILGVLVTAFSWKGRTFLVLALLVGAILPSLYFNQLVRDRDAYLTSTQPDYVQTITAHPLWHTAYIGFGYLHNDQGLAYLDEVGMAKVASIDPTVAYLSPRYEDILRQQTLTLIRTQPLFAIQTIFSKLGILLLLYLPFFGNYGLWQAFRKRLGGKVYYPFYGAMAFAALAGIIAIPDLRYVLGFAALALFYGLTILNTDVSPQ